MGGSAHLWSVILSDNIIPGSNLLIDLTMTKFLAPDVRIAYELRVEDSSLFVDGFESGDTMEWSSAIP